MSDSMMMGIFRFMIPIPRLIWKRQLPGKARSLTADLAFMSAHHHQVRNYVVSELPRMGKGLSPESIAKSLNMTLPQVNEILDDLEAHKVYLFRDEQGAVTWAYPCTVDTTPHHLKLSTGENIYAA